MEAASLYPHGVPFFLPSTGLRRHRAAYAGLATATVVVGLASRRYAGAFPDAIRLYAGDVLWAAMVYFLAAAAWPRAAIGRIAIGALAFSVLIEASQLYHAPWIDGLRATRVGGLVLGFGFLWSDVVCYAAGVALAALVDAAIVGRSTARSLRPERPDDIVS